MGSREQELIRDRNCRSSRIQPPLYRWPPRVSGVLPQHPRRGFVGVDPLPTPLDARRVGSPGRHQQQRNHDRFDAVRRRPHCFRGFCRFGEKMPNRIVMRSCSPMRCPNSIQSRGRGNGKRRDRWCLTLSRLDHHLAWTFSGRMQGEFGVLRRLSRTEEKSDRQK